jgi:integrase
VPRSLVGAKWGAIVVRHQATWSLLERSIHEIYQASRHNQTLRPTLGISFASRGSGSNPLSSTEFFQVRRPVRVSGSRLGSQCDPVGRIPRRRCRRDKLPDPGGSARGGAGSGPAERLGADGHAARAGGRPSQSLTLEQASALLEAAEASRLHAFIVLCLLTGARSEEARALTWEHVDLVS